MSRPRHHHRLGSSEVLRSWDLPTLYLPALSSGWSGTLIWAVNLSPFRQLVAVLRQGFSVDILSHLTFDGASVPTSRRSSCWGCTHLWERCLSTGGARLWIRDWHQIILLSEWLGILTCTSLLLDAGNRQLIYIPCFSGRDWQGWLTGGGF